MAYVLMTGSTGLLGRYLLRDLLLRDQRLAIVARGATGAAAQDRIETALTYWERQLGRALPRPVVLEGNIHQRDLGLDADDIAWVGKHCESIIHSAASLTFHAESADGEPWRSNVAGTRNVLALCEKTGIDDFHHVSTAYVAGLRQGLCHEDELDVGQQLGNDYEKSKVASEREVRNAQHLRCVTVYRPSIITGDASTGYTTTFHGFYSPLRLVHSLMGSGTGVEDVLQVDFLGTLGLTGEECKNFVPVDWVSAVMTYLFTSPEHHGATYHLTSPEPVQARDMLKVCEEALIAHMQSSPAKKTAAYHQSGQFEQAFHEQMRVYQSYWRDDPKFDSTNTQTAARHLPCPKMDRQRLRLLADEAIKANFGWPREPTVRVRGDIAAQLLALCGQRLPSADWQSSDLPQSGSQNIGIEITGNGGGGWTLGIAAGEVVEVTRGLEDDLPLTLYLNSATFEALREASLSPDEALRCGRVVAWGEWGAAGQASRAIAAALSASRTAPMAPAMR